MSSFERELELAGSESHLSRRWRALLAGEFDAGAPLNSTSSVLESSRVVKSGAGMLFGIAGFNSKVAAQFIQIFDVEGALPANGAVPVFVLTVPTVANFSVSWIFPGRFFYQGIVIANSSTAATLTIGSADCFFDAQYL